MKPNFCVPRSVRVTCKGALLLAFVFGNLLSGCDPQAPPQAVRPEASAPVPNPSVTPAPVTPSPVRATSQIPQRSPRPIAPTPVAIAPVPSPITALPPTAAPRTNASPGSPGTPALTADPNNPDILRDYATMTPLPETGRVTVRADINSFDLDRLITDCPTDTALYAFAESSNYRVQICSEEYDPWLPKYYIGRAKDGGDELRLINKNTDEARQLIFRNGDYMYTLYRDGARSERMNAYLEIYSAADRKTYAEALVYLYEKMGRP